MDKLKYLRGPVRKEPTLPYYKTDNSPYSEDHQPENRKMKDTVSDQIKKPFLAIKPVFASTHVQEKWTLENQAPGQRPSPSAFWPHARSSLDGFLEPVQFPVRRVFRAIMDKDDHLGGPVWSVLAVVIIIVMMYSLFAMRLLGASR